MRERGGGDIEKRERERETERQRQRDRETEIGEGKINGEIKYLYLLDTD